MRYRITYKNSVLCLLLNLLPQEQVIWSVPDGVGRSLRQADWPRSGRHETTVQKSRVTSREFFPSFLS